MPRGHALLVGLKSVDPLNYGGWDGTGGCWGCELDVDNLHRILDSQGFSIAELKTQQATASAMLRGLQSAADSLQSGDCFVFYYSGHGGQQPDTNGDELDGHDETLVAFDREVIDDELNKIWKSFSRGVRIVMVSDSCNSGTNYKNIRTIHKSTPINLDLKRGRSKGVDAQMIHYGGCRDSSTSAGYRGGGAFTIALCEAWANGRFTGNYVEFHRRIVELMHDESQQPQINEYGTVTDTFRNQRPFQIARTSFAPGSDGNMAAFMEETRGQIEDLNDRVQQLEFELSAREGIAS